MRHLQRFWRDWNLVRETRTWLLANQNSTLVMDAMYHLNHEVKSYPSRSEHAQAVYGLKNELVKWLYQNGYCVHVSQERQTFECWNCDGTGSDGWNDYEYCDSCDGTGVYREHILYRFVFEYQGRRYIWHQPSSLVTWDVEVSDNEIGKFQESSNPISKTLTSVFYNHYTGVVYAFLRLHGVPAKSLPTGMTLWVAIKAEWMDTHQYYVWRRFKRRFDDFKWSMKERATNLKRLWAYVGTGELPAREAEYDDIPF